MAEETGVTAAAVAARAGVSDAVVAYVLDGQDGIPEAVRERVRSAVEELRYRPGSAARAMRLGVSNVVVFLPSGWPTGGSAGALVRRLTARCSEFGYAVLACDTTRTPPGLWAAASPRAVLSLDTLSEDEAGAAGHAAIVAAGAAKGGTPEPSAFEYGTRAGELQVRHLIERGHRRLAYAYDPSNVGWFDAGRRAGAAWAAEQAGLHLVEQAVVASERESADAAITAWVASRVSGVGAASDDLALSLVAACRRLAVSTPGLLSVVGADDELAGRLAEPTLSTVDPAAITIADRLALRALRLLGEDVADPPDALGAVALIERESTRVPT